MSLLLWGVTIVFIPYAVLPSMISRLFGLGVFRRGHMQRQIALTFDDGPDPRYTPLLLDLLKKHNIKATFFILGIKAEKHPELVLRIHREGHLIGIHNYNHKSNWLMSPRAVRQQIESTADIVERITGERPIYYRPPWGLINIFDFLNKRTRIVLWSIMPGDWRTRIAKNKLKRKLTDRIKLATQSQIVVLHDSGETFGADQDAPLYMISALGEFLREKEPHGFDCVRIDQMLGDTAVTS